MNYVICSKQRIDAAASVKPLVMSDEEIEFWGGVYLANPTLSMLGFTFEAFLTEPRRILPAAEFSAIFSLTEFFDRLPLLPAQRAVRERLDAQDAGQIELALGVSESRLTADSPVVQGGALVEKMKHHAHPRHAARRELEEM